MPVEFEQPKWATLTVTSYQTAENNENQWAIKGRWEWTPSGNRWGITTWVDKNICPPVISQGAHNVLVERGRLQNKQDGTPHDGSMDWMYNWRIIQWDPAEFQAGQATIPAPMNHSATTSAPPPQQPVPQQPVPQQPVPQQPVPQQPVPQQPAPELSSEDWKLGITNVTENEMRIMRQTALKCASWQMVPLVKDFASPEMMLQRTIELSEMYLYYFCTGEEPTPDSVLGTEPDF